MSTLLCRADTVVAGSLLEVREAGERIVLTRLADGSIVAFDPLCPHRQGPLWAGRVAGDCIVCPWHGFRFDLRSGATDGMQSIMHLRRHAVSVRDGLVYLD